jgi:hypothetical protein
LRKPEARLHIFLLIFFFLEEEDRREARIYRHFVGWQVKVNGS